jgi:hypothetical protein
LRSNSDLRQNTGFEQHFQRISQAHAAYVYMNCVLYFIMEENIDHSPTIEDQQIISKNQASQEQDNHQNMQMDIKPTGEDGVTDSGDRRSSSSRTVPTERREPGPQERLSQMGQPMSTLTIGTSRPSLVGTVD